MEKKAKPVDVKTSDVDPRDAPKINFPENKSNILSAHPYVVLALTFFLGIILGVAISKTSWTRADYATLFGILIIGLFVGLLYLKPEIAGTSGAFSTLILVVSLSTVACYLYVDLEHFFKTHNIRWDKEAIAITVKDEIEVIQHIASQTKLIASETQFFASQTKKIVDEMLIQQSEFSKKTADLDMKTQVAVKILGQLASFTNYLQIEASAKSWCIKDFNRLKEFADNASFPYNVEARRAWKLIDRDLASQYFMQSTAPSVDWKKIGIASFSLGELTTQDFYDYYFAAEKEGKEEIAEALLLELSSQKNISCQQRTKIAIEILKNGTVMRSLLIARKILAYELGLDKRFQSNFPDFVKEAEDAYKKKYPSMASTTTIIGPASPPNLLATETIGIASQSIQGGAL